MFVVRLKRALGPAQVTCELQTDPEGPKCTTPDMITQVWFGLVG